MRFLQRESGLLNRLVSDCFEELLSERAPLYRFHPVCRGFGRGDGRFGFAILRAFASLRENHRIRKDVGSRKGAKPAKDRKVGHYCWRRRKMVKPFRRAGVARHKKHPWARP